MKKSVNKYIIRSIYIFILILLIPYILRISTIFDEDYSLILVHNDFLRIIKFDSLDVHPPLFYFILKSFLNVTTFWTNSFIVQVIFSRIFMIFISVITFLLMRNICNCLNVHNNIYIQDILFLFIPGVISFTYNLIKIRMYSLGALLITLEIYEIIKYEHDHRNKRICLIGISLILNIYTNYYSAFIAGLFIVIALTKCLLNKNDSWKKYVFLIILMFISSIPWVPVLFNQISLQKYHPLPNDIFTQWIATLIFILVFSYTIYWSYKHLNYEYSNLFLEIFSVLIILFVFMSIVSIFYRPVFQFRYFYPIYLIYGFFSVNTIYIMLKHNHNIYAIMVMAFLLITCLGSYINQISYFSKSSMSVIKDSCILGHSNDRIIHLRSNNNDVNDNFNLEKSIILSYKNKRIHVSNISDIKEIRINPSYEQLFSNVNNHICK